jgi:chromosome segregation ATPase
MTDSKQVEQIARAAQPLFDWIKQYYPKIDISDDKQLSLYTSYHNLSQVLDKLKEDHNAQESDTTGSEQSGEAGSQIRFANFFLHKEYNAHTIMSFAESETKHLQAELTQAREALETVMECKDEWTERALKAESQLMEAREEIERLEDTVDNLKHLMANVEQRGYSKALQEVADLGLKNLSQQPRWVKMMTTKEAWELYAKDPSYATKSYNQFAEENRFMIIQLAESTPQPDNQSKQNS